MCFSVRKKLSMKWWLEEVCTFIWSDCVKIRWSYEKMKKERKAKQKTCKGTANGLSDLIYCNSNIATNTTCEGSPKVLPQFYGTYPCVCLYSVMRSSPFKRHFYRLIWMQVLSWIFHSYSVLTGVIVEGSVWVILSIYNTTFCISKCYSCPLNSLSFLFFSLCILFIVKRFFPCNFFFFFLCFIITTSMFLMQQLSIHTVSTTQWIEDQFQINGSFEKKSNKL